MATTVTYKGNTLTTATNQTKILKTAGKYMEDDVTITDESAGGVVVTEEIDVGGGIIKHITSGVVISGTKQITSNGTYDVSTFALAEVDIPGGSYINGDNLTWGD